MADPFNDLEAIIGELDAAAGTAASPGDEGAIEQWLAEVVR